MKNKRIPDFSIYAVIDRSSCLKASLPRIVKDCIKAKIEIIQLRDKTEDTAGFLKNALWTKKIIRETALFLINDRADIAKLSDADGLHLGQSDLPIAAARRIIGTGKIIGKSCHNLQQAIVAAREGADYIGIGPIFKTPTKPEYKPVGLNLLREARKRLKIPIVAIGGINKGNAHLLRKTGVKSIALVRAVCQEKNIPETIEILRKNAF